MVKVNNDHLHAYGYQKETKRRQLGQLELEHGSVPNCGAKPYHHSSFQGTAGGPPPSYIPKPWFYPHAANKASGNYTSRQSLVSEQRQSQGTGTKQLTLAQSNPIQSMAGRSFSSSPKLQPLYKPPHPSTTTPPTHILSSDSYHKART